LLELLSILDHLINLGRRETSDRVGDGDVGTTTGGLVESGNLEETVGINLEGTDELGLSTGLRGDTREFEFSEETVLLAGNTLSLVDGEGDGSLVVLNGGEGSGLVGRDRSVTGYDDTENVTLHGNTEGERSCSAITRVKVSFEEDEKLKKGGKSNLPTSRRRRSAVFSEVCPVRTAA
jgi:hypothetical protein